MEEPVVVSILTLSFCLIFGFPLYLLKNFGGQHNYSVKWVSHYFPSAPIFEKHQALGVIYSNLGLLLWIVIQCFIGYKYGFLTPIAYFVIPWVQVNMWLVCITYLQHTDARVPHYSNSEWDFLKGALATIDRDWGVLNIFFHHITDTHVVHHLFSTLPFYNAQAALETIKPILGDYYLNDDGAGIVASLWESWRYCRFVDPEDKIMFYKY